MKRYIHFDHIFIPILAFAVFIPYSKVLFNFSLFHFLLILFIFYFILFKIIITKILFSINYLVINLLFFSLFIVSIFSKNLIYLSIVLQFTIFNIFYFIFKREYSKMLFVKNYIFLICISCLLSLLQYLGFDFAWYIRNLFGIPNDEIVLLQLSERVKGVGLAYYSVQFSYQILLGLSLTLIFCNTKKTITHFIYLFLLIGALTTKSTSMILIIFISYIYILKVNLKLILILLILCIILNFENIFFYFKYDSSIVSRLFQYQIFYNLLPNIPYFGYPLEEIDLLKNEYSLLNTNSDWYGIIGFHNSFITSLLENGPFVFLMYLLIYLYSILNSYKNNIYIFVMFLYIFKSSIHNAGIQTADIYGLILIALLTSNRYYKHE
jgi:hypothetical protein